MKIGSAAEKPVLQPVAQGTQSASDATKAAAAVAAAAPATAKAAEAGAKLELSNTASTLLSAGASPEFDAAKVARISDAIDSGTFKVNPEAIADKLIANAQELLSNTKG